MLLNVNDGMRVMSEEIFGPVLPIVPYDTLADALGYINQRDRPFALYWFGTDRAARDQVLVGTIAGGVSVNDTSCISPRKSCRSGGRAVGAGALSWRVRLSAVLQGKTGIRAVTLFGSRHHTAALQAIDRARIAWLSRFT